MTTKYSYDSLGAPEEIIDDERPITGNDWKGQDIREDERVLTYTAWRRDKGLRNYQKEYLFEDDIYEYIKTLERDNLLEILEKVDVKDIVNAADMKEVYL